MHEPAKQLLRLGHPSRAHCGCGQVIGDPGPLLWCICKPRIWIHTVPTLILDAASKRATLRMLRGHSAWRKARAPWGTRRRSRLTVAANSRSLPSSGLRTELRQSRTARLALCLFVLAASPGYSCAGGADSVWAPFPPASCSLGQPASFPVRWGLLLGYNFDRERSVSHLFVDVSHPILGPKLGGFEASVEAAAGSLGASSNAAIGAYLGLPWFAAGTEYAGHGEKLTAAVSLRFPGHRGGLVGRGDMLRLDYHAGRKELLAGISLRPPSDPCRLTRPRQTGVLLPKSPAPRPISQRSENLLGADVERQLDVVLHSIIWMDRMLTPCFDPNHFEKEASVYRDHIRLPGHTYLEEDAAYHRALDGAFSAALDGDTLAGHTVAALAESVLFREVLVPFDQLFGQEKTPADAGGYCDRAVQVFDRRLAEVLPSAFHPESREARPRACSREIMRRVLVAIRRVSSEAGERWKRRFIFWSNRGALAWIPLNYGLRPEQYDTQVEWDGVLAAVTGQAFTGANTVAYLMMEQFHPELKRMIRDAQDYQVTIIHDLRGRTPGGNADLYGWDLVVDGYMAAFIQGVHDLDAGKRTHLPQFFLFLDANYYEVNGSRPLVDYLENLYRPRLPQLKPREFGGQVATAHEMLVQAIRNSPNLRGASERRLRETFKVHVSITNPFDPSFMLDLTRRDHRKVAFRDISEDDPSAGIALVTGQGIGEHYNGSGWEDRSLLLRGPTLVQLKTAARNLMFHQGFREREIPEILRPHAYPGDYADRCARLRERGWTTSADILMNETGYGTKEASVLKAAIYNLAPPGSVLLSYDSLWISEFWAGMFLCAALRGANMFPVGPAPPNAPSASITTLSFLRTTLRMMLEARLYFAEDLKRAGGQLYVGIYAHDAQTNDLRKRADAFLRGMANHSFLRELFPVDPSVEEFLRKFRDQFEQVPFVELQLRPRPFLHMKSQLFGTTEAFRILGVPEMSRTLRTHLKIRQDQMQGIGNQGIGPGLYQEQIRAFQARLDILPSPQKNHVIFTFTTGSHNQDPRSMLLDGEVLVAISGYDCLIALIDFMFVLYVSDWPSTQVEFDRLFPPQHPPMYMKPIMKALKDQS